MKNSIKTFLAALLLLVSHTVFSQNNVCESSYYPFQKGTKMELTHYDKKGKPSGITKQHILELTEIAGGIKATIETTSTDEKGKNEQQMTFDMECRDNSVYVDMRSMMNPSSMAGMKDMEMEISGDALVMPNELTPGMALPDGQMEMKAMMNGMALMNMKLSITNRKVEGMETVTTPAGTFDCVKLTQETELKTIVKMKMSTTTWFAKGVGMVKTENYDKNGKLEGSSVLTKLEK